MKSRGANPDNIHSDSGMEVDLHRCRIVHDRWNHGEMPSARQPKASSKYTRCVTCRNLVTMPCVLCNTLRFLGRLP